MKLTVLLFLICSFLFINFSLGQIDSDLQKLNDALVASMDSTTSTADIPAPPPIPTNPTFEILNITAPTTADQAGNNLVQLLVKFWEVLDATRCLCLTNAGTAPDCLANGVYFYALKSYKDAPQICANIASYCTTRTPCTDKISAYLTGVKTDFVWTLVQRKVFNELTVPIDNDKPDLTNWCNQFLA